MTFEIHDLPSGGLIFKGKLIQKKLTAKSRRHIMLCFPQTVADVAMLFDFLKNNPTGGETDGLEEPTVKEMAIYGHLSLAAISGFPLLIVGTNVKTFIHFSQIVELCDEQDLGSACSFALITAHSEYRFFSETSTDYQKWVGALTRAFEGIAGKSQLENFRPASPVAEAEAEGMSREASALSSVNTMSRNESDYIETAQRTLTSDHSNRRRSTSRRRRSLTLSSLAGKTNSVSSLQWNNGQLSTRNYNDEPVIPRRKSISFFATIKAVFSKKKSSDNLDYRGRDSGGQNQLKRGKSKSITRFFSSK